MTELAEVIESLLCTDGEALYWDRVRNDIRLRDMARRLGLTPRQLSDLENGRAPVTEEMKLRHHESIWGNH